MPLSLDALAYRIRDVAPLLYRGVERVAGLASAIRFGSSIRKALDTAALYGSVRGANATIRPLLVEELAALRVFFGRMPATHLRFFRPHGMDTSSVRKVLSRRDYLTYGLWINSELAGYAIIKVFLSGKGYVGLLVDPEHTGIGLGTFLWKYLFWQCQLVGVSAHATVHPDNKASLESARRIHPMEMCGKARNGYLFVCYPVVDADKTPPTLKTKPSGLASHPLRDRQ